MGSLLLPFIALGNGAQDPPFRYELIYAEGLFGEIREMSTQPPPPPSRKPPSALPPPAGQPMAKPPAPGNVPAGHQSGGYYQGGHPPPEEEPARGSAGRIVGIIAAVIFVLFVLPGALCLGLFFYWGYQAQQIIAEEQAAEERRLQEEAQQRQVQEQAILNLLADRLYPQAKVDIGIHWTEPDGVRRRRWADWTARKISDNRYEVSGILELGIKDAGARTYRWGCEYSTFDNPRNAAADWKLERITVDGEAAFP